MTPLLADANDALEMMQASALSWVALAVVLVVLAGVSLWMRTRFRDDSDPAAASAEMLLVARDSRRRGDISDEEYRSIKGRLLEQRVHEESANAGASAGRDAPAKD